MYSAKPREFFGNESILPPSKTVFQRTSSDLQNVDKPVETFHRPRKARTARGVTSAAGMRPYVVAEELARQVAVFAIGRTVRGRGEEVAGFRLAGFTQETNKERKKLIF
jgi:hypothetical protein